ncbi:WXG100 family type VII secretion target [Allokutzneria oryzae]|uniref:WXG100 family type VII secretion target n=1 Tax=Allokutzneria oryzae TaxID=1378989 RepID=A0ABV5ZY21_9PSEU
MTGPGTFAELNSAGNQKNWFEKAAGQGSSWIGAAQDLADATSPPEIGIATVSARAELLQTLASPCKALADNGLGFLVSMVMAFPVYLAERAIGDPEQMRATGEGWAKVGGWLDQVAEAERRRAAATEEIWQGQAATAFRAQMTDFADAVKALADDVRELKDILDTIADLFDMFVEFAIEAITELVIGLIVQWLAALAASWATCGTSVSASMAMTSARIGKTASSVAKEVSSLQRKLGSELARLEGLLTKLRGQSGIRQVLTQMERKRNGGFFGKQLVNAVDKQSHVGRIFSRAEMVMPEKQFQELTEEAFAPLRHKLPAELRDKPLKELQDMPKVWEHLPGSRASTTANRFLRETTGSTALAANISERILTSMVGGSTNVWKAGMNAGIAVGTDVVIEKGAEAVYDKATDPVAPKEQRRADQVRGFSTDPLHGGNA